MRVAIVAGELSGDLLGAGLIRALRERLPALQVEGIGGPRMCAEGLESLHPMEALSVMGLAEVLGSLPQLLRLRAQLARRWRENPPDVFIGIDAPDFNLGLEEQLRDAGVVTVHYVSPSVWAWRQGRMKKIRRAVDLMLTLFPFEKRFYDEQGLAAAFVGHPAAERFAGHPGVQECRRKLGLPQDGEIVALLPGSRMSEVNRLGPLFAQTAAAVRAGRPGLRFVAPMASAAIRAVFSEHLHAAGLSDDTVLLTDGESEFAMGAADCILLASGTATLEAMLLERPMVMAYRLAPATYFILRRLGLIKIDRFALPNLLARDRVVPEFIQDAATPEALSGALLELLDDPARRRRIVERFGEMHEMLRQNADQRAAEAILECLSKRS